MPLPPRPLNMNYSFVAVWAHIYILYECPTLRAFRPVSIFVVTQTCFWQVLFVKFTLLGKYLFMELRVTEIAWTFKCKYVVRT